MKMLGRSLASLDRALGAGGAGRTLSTRLGARTGALLGLRREDEFLGRTDARARQRREQTSVSAHLNDRRRPMGPFGLARTHGGKALWFDQRQRVVVRAHYFGHGGGGGYALLHHARYLAREADKGREGAAASFYDANTERVDALTRLKGWARQDLRHFRIVLAPERGAALGELAPFVRDVMARAEAALDHKLDWVAIDHHNTSHPHTHIVVRGRRGDGRPLAMPQDYLLHGLRESARDAASEWLGPRQGEDKRARLARDAALHGPARLDALIARHLDGKGRLALGRLHALETDPDLVWALKLRLKELERLGLARAHGQGLAALERDWRRRLDGLERDLGDRRGLVLTRRAKARTPGLERDL